MSTICVDALFRQSLIESIAAYQKHLSPRKGFSCAHRLLHGDRSCSDYAKAILASQTLGAAAPLIYQRFKQCAESSRSLSAAQSGCIVIPCCLPL
jgi:putative component of membrane protein insertase Oxa1/YidC/SpoIIIJ protein YidD